MKLSGSILSDALRFALTESVLLSVLGPVDSSPAFTISDISCKIASVADHSAVIEIAFTYISTTDNGEGSVVIATVYWLQGTGFNITNVAKET